MAASGKAGVGEINVPISCGGVSVQPGDIIVGDCDGVTVIPQGTEEKVLTDSIEKIEKDEKRAASVSRDVVAIKKYLEDFIAKAKKS